MDLSTEGRDAGVGEGVGDGWRCGSAGAGGEGEDGAGGGESAGGEDGILDGRRDREGQCEHGFGGDILGYACGEFSAGGEPALGKLLIE